MHKKTTLLALGFFVVLTFSCQQSTQQIIPGDNTPESFNTLLPKKEYQRTDSTRVKNIILIIGDGTGLSQVSSAFYFKKETPNYHRFRYVGLIRTSSTEKITDSAAGATAFSAGIKTYNGAISVDPQKNPVQTIVEYLSPLNWNTGVIATSSITHATPACFYAHTDSRGKAEDIASDMVESDIDFFAGGGLEYFQNRSDNRDLVEELKNKGFEIRTDQLSSGESDKLGFLLAKDAMPTMLDGRGDFLPEATRLAIESLSKNGQSFFLMSEGSQVDWGGHDNNSAYLVSELLDLDETIGVALDFAEKNGNTLVVVTADHETGGFTLSSKNDNYNQIQGTFSTDGHSTTLIPVFAYGPGAELFSGIYENTEIYHKLISLIDQ